MPAIRRRRCAFERRVGRGSAAPPRYHYPPARSRHIYKSPDRATCWLRVYSPTPSIGILRRSRACEFDYFGETCASRSGPASSETIAKPSPGLARRFLIFEPKVNKEYLERRTKKDVWMFEEKCANMFPWVLTSSSRFSLLTGVTS